jgi:aminoglycoside phosphotransferase (APT) family kinase protein
MNNGKVIIDISTVRQLIAAQFSEWKELPIRPVASSGWDNKTFHLGDFMLIRMPSASTYALQVEKEQKWLPKLAPMLPLPIPIPLAIGHPAYGYPWKWSVYQWLEGDTAASGYIADLCDFATSLGQFLLSLHNIDTKDGPLAGLHSFYRGGSLTHYDSETRQAINVLRARIDVQAATEIWEKALSTTWKNPPVWVHGDISAGNLLVKNGQLSGVIDFGQLAVGDPSCDLAIAWTLFNGKSREVFRQTLSLDSETWARGRAWTLWKSLIVAAAFTDPNNIEAAQCWRIIDEVIADHKMRNDE